MWVLQCKWDRDFNFSNGEWVVLDRRQSGTVGGMGIDIVVPICGIRGCINETVRDVRGRALAS